MNQQMQELRHEEVAQLTEDLELTVYTTLDDLEKDCRFNQDGFRLGAVQACRRAIDQEMERDDDTLKHCMFALALMEDVLEMPDLTYEYADEMPASFIVAYRMYRMRTQEERKAALRKAILSL